MILSVRPFALDDLDGAAAFAERTRVSDPWVEPFGHRLAMIATGPRARLDLWRVAEDEAGVVAGVSFAAVREGGTAPVLDLYAAVAPTSRRQGLGRALCEPAVASGSILRARARPGTAGVSFLSRLGFAEAGAQLQLTWSGRAPPVELSALRIRAGGPEDEALLLRLSEAAWSGAPEAFASRPDEIAQLVAEQGRLLLFAEVDRSTAAYLSGVFLGKTLGIEEVAVLPAFRRMGIGRALLARALAAAQSAVLSVNEANRPARALYRSLGFKEAARRVVMELRDGR